MKAIFASALLGAVATSTSNEWTRPKVDDVFPNLDIGYYQLTKGAGNCHKCISLSSKSIFGNYNPDCRAVLAEGADVGNVNLVPMA